MRELPIVIHAQRVNGTWYFRLSDGTNAKRTADGKSTCLNPRCIAKRMSWDCPHSTAAALWSPAKTCLPESSGC